MSFAPNGLVIHIGKHDVYLDGKGLNATLGALIVADSITVSTEGNGMFSVSLTLLADNAIFGEPTRPSGAEDATSPRVPQPRKQHDS